MKYYFNSIGYAEFYAHLEKAQGRRAMKNTEKVVDAAGHV